MTFELILAVDGSVLSSADSPGDLDYSRAYPYERWGVVVRHTSSDGLATFTKCAARVNLCGAKDYRKAAGRAVRIVRDWLVAGDATDDFDIRDYLSDDLFINIKFPEAEDDD